MKNLLEVYHCLVCFREMLNEILPIIVFEIFLWEFVLIFCIFLRLWGNKLLYGYLRGNQVLPQHSLRAVGQSCWNNFFFFPPPLLLHTSEVSCVPLFAWITDVVLLFVGSDAPDSTQALLLTEGSISTVQPASLSELSNVTVLGENKSCAYMQLWPR